MSNLAGALAARDKKGLRGTFRQDDRQAAGLISAMPCLTLTLCHYHCFATQTWDDFTRRPALFRPGRSAYSFSSTTTTTAGASTNLRAAGPAHQQKKTPLSYGNNGYTRGGLGRLPPLPPCPDLCCATLSCIVLRCLVSCCTIPLEK